jgi:hypothetical protein
VVDESGEDYLYPETYFVSIQLLEQVKRAIAATAWEGRPTRQCCGRRYAPPAVSQ